MKSLTCLFSLIFTVSVSFASDNILIKGGTVYDGTSNEPVQADVLISGKKIIAVGDSDKFKKKTVRTAKVIDAAGLVVTPGFIDPHSHVNTGLMKKKTKDGKGYLRMGVTTVLCGVCGSSPLPLSSCADTLTKNGSGLNVGFFVGLGSVRNNVMGKKKQQPDSGELAKMEAIVRQEMKWGAFGVSSGLIYLPGSYSKTPELIALTKVASQFGGIYTTHMRSESSAILKALDEAVSIGRETGADVNISHIKCTGKKARGLSSAVIAAIEKAQQEGLHITADQYPYDASSTSLSATLLPSWARVGKVERNKMYDNPEKLAKVKAALHKKFENNEGGKNYVIAPTTQDKEIAGKSIAQIAEQWQLTPEDATIKIFRKSSPSVVNHSICEEDIRNFMIRPWVMTGSDGNARGGHPRSRGTYAKKIRKYVNEEHLITLGEMIRRSTGLVADTYGIAKRGYIRKGYWADVIVFDPTGVKDNNSYETPAKYATGFCAVIVNGEIAVENDKPTGALAGVVIKRDNSAKVR